MNKKTNRKLKLSRSTTTTIKILTIGTILGFGIANLLIYSSNILENQIAPSIENSHLLDFQHDTEQEEKLKKTNQIRILCWVMTKPSNQEI